ncbi:MAG: AraC family transcriptional regulator [Spirochaetaceae bacterium]|nr:MAG: AraC family transcriptional regulator [Spirochaetaceae bacterium]
MLFGYPSHDLPADDISRRLNDLRVVVNAFGHQHDDPSAVCDDRVTGDIELVFYNGGIAIVEIESMILRPRRDQAIVIPPFAHHSIGTDPADPHDNYYLHFDVEPLYRREEIVSLLTASGTHFIVSPSSPDRLRGVYEAIASLIAARPPGYLAAVTGLASAIVAELVGDATASRPAVAEERARGTYDERADRVIRFLSDAIGQAVDIDSIAAACGMSRTTLHAVVRGSFETTPMRLLSFLRLRRAEQLLRSTALSVKEIAATVGFRSPYHFSSEFSNRYRVSPSAFRSANRRV